MQRPRARVRWSVRVPRVRWSGRAPGCADAGCGTGGTHGRPRRRPAGLNCDFVERYKTVRNVAIVVAIAAAIYFIPGGGRAASTFAAALWAAFGVAIGLFGLYLYREGRVRAHGLGDRHRAILYGSIALVVFAWVSRARMWSGEVGKPAWFLLVGAAVGGLIVVYRHSRAY
jgi:hypothetical protein